MRSKCEDIAGSYEHASCERRPYAVCYRMQSGDGPDEFCRADEQQCASCAKPSKWSPATIVKPCRVLDAVDLPASMLE